MTKKALITGVTGQDGAYLAEFLLGKGYEVHGIKRRTSLFNTDRIDHLYQDPHETGRKFILHHGDLTDSSSLIRIIQQVQPDEIYNLAEAYGMYACNGILFNHESPIRGETFVTRKITRALARIKLGLQDCLFLGNMDAKRDWGHAKDYVEMQWLMLQQDQAEDFVIATGVQYSVRDFVNAAAKELGMEIRWEGQGVDEKGYLVRGASHKGQVTSKPQDVSSLESCNLQLETGDRPIVAVDPRYFRPTEVETLLGDPSKAKNKLGWTPKISFDELVSEMVREDLKAAERDELVKKHGYKAMDYHE